MSDIPRPTQFLTECRFCGGEVGRLYIACPNCAKKNFVLDFEDEIDTALLHNCARFWDLNAHPQFPHPDRRDPDQMIARGEWGAYRTVVDAWLSCINDVAGDTAESTLGRIAQLEVLLTAMRFGPQRCMSEAMRDAILLATLKGQLAPGHANHFSSED